MAEDSPTVKKPLVVGANHRTSSLSLRDRLFVEDAAMRPFLERLRACGIDEAVMLSTCDRVEVQASHPDRDAGTRAITEALAGHAGLAPDEIASELYTYWDRSAVRHIFAVTASLDSQVLGEPQVLGQVKAGHRMAREVGMCGSLLDGLFQAAYGAAKRVRTETAIGERPVSIAAAAVQLARDLHGDLGRCTGVLIGAGEMGELVAGDMIAGGLRDLTVLHPKASRAQAIARTLDCHVAAFLEMSRVVAEADVILAALGRRQYVLNSDMIAAALRKRRRRPVFLVDAAVPGDIDPAVNRLDGAFLYDVTDLEQVAMAGRANREAEAASAWEIVDSEVAAFLHGRAERAAVPALSRLRAHFEEVREQVLSDADGNAERATRLLINRLLHGPSRAMRAIAASRETDGLDGAEQTLNQLFGLNSGTAGSDGENEAASPPPSEDDAKG